MRKGRASDRGARIHGAKLTVGTRWSHHLDLDRECTEVRRAVCLCSGLGRITRSALPSSRGATFSAGGSVREGSTESDAGVRVLGSAAAREAIEALRDGTVPRAHASMYTVGRERYLQALSGDLDFIAAGGYKVRFVVGD